MLVVFFNRSKGNNKKWRYKKMRLIRYYVINKETGKGIYTNCKESACKAFVEALDNKEAYAIVYKWLSL